MTHNCDRSQLRCDFESSHFGYMGLFCLLQEKDVLKGEMCYYY